jgi:hypothetical protein
MPVSLVRWDRAREIEIDSWAEFYWYCLFSSSSTDIGNEIEAKKKLVAHFRWAEIDIWYILLFFALSSFPRDLILILTRKFPFQLSPSKAFLFWQSDRCMRWIIKISANNCQHTHSGSRRHVIRSFHVAEQNLLNASYFFHAVRNFAFYFDVVCTAVWRILKYQNTFQYHNWVDMWANSRRRTDISLIYLLQ